MLKQTILLSMLALSITGLNAMNGRDRNDTERDVAGKAAAIWWRSCKKVAEDKKKRETAGKVVKTVAESCNIL